MNTVKIHNYRCFRTFIKDAVEAKKKHLPGLTFSKIADFTGIQKSYLSQVLNGKSYLNPDQLFLIGKKIGLTSDEIQYLSLLMDYDRCQVPERKQQLEKEINLFQSNHIKSKDYIDYESMDKVANESFARYYSDPYCSLVHIFLNIEKYRYEPSKIIERLDITSEKYGEVLEVLEECGLIGFSKGSLEVIKKSIHLDSESWLSRVSATMSRIRAMEAHQRSTNKQDYFFSATFSSDENTRAEVKKLYLEFLQRATKKIKKGDVDDVFQMNFDLFVI